MWCAHDIVIKIIFFFNKIDICACRSENDFCGWPECSSFLKIHLYIHMQQYTWYTYCAHCWPVNVCVCVCVIANSNTCVYVNQYWESEKKKIKLRDGTFCMIRSWVCVCVWSYRHHRKKYGERSSEENETYDIKRGTIIIIIYIFYDKFYPNTYYLFLSLSLLFLHIYLWLMDTFHIFFLSLSLSIFLDQFLCNQNNELIIHEVLVSSP